MPDERLSLDKHRFIATCLLVFLLLAATAAIAKEPIHLAPSSPWAVNYSDDSCRLVRQFGPDDDKVTLFLDRFGPGEDFSAIISGDRLKLYREHKNISIRFGPNEVEQKLEFFKGKMGDDTSAIILRGEFRIAPLSDTQQKQVDALKPGQQAIFPDIGPEREAAVTFIEIGAPVSPPVILETGSMAKPFAAMRTCIDELLTHWGIDVVRHATLSRRVKPLTPPAKWLTSSDYPTHLVRSGQQALVQVRLSVDATGNASACHIQRSTKPIEFDNAVCKNMMQQAKFSPALDKDGLPIASFYRNTVVFVIP